MNCIPDTIKIVSTRPPEFLPLNPNSRPNCSYSPKARRRDPSSWLKRGDINLEGLAIEDPFHDEKESNNVNTTLPESGISKVNTPDPTDDVPKDIAFLGESTAAIAFDLEDDLDDDEELEIIELLEKDDELEIVENDDNDDGEHDVTDFSCQNAHAVKEKHTELKVEEDDKLSRDAPIATNESSNSPEVHRNMRSTEPSSRQESALPANQVKSSASRPRGLDRSCDSDDDKSRESIAWEKPVWLTKKLRPSRRADAVKVKEDLADTSTIPEQKRSVSGMDPEERTSKPKSIASDKKRIEWEKPEWTKKKPLRTGGTHSGGKTAKEESATTFEESPSAALPKTDVEKSAESTIDMTNPVDNELSELEDSSKKKKTKKPKTKTKTKKLVVENDEIVPQDTKTVNEHKVDTLIATSVTVNQKKVEWEKPSWAVKKPELKSTSRGAALKSGVEFGSNDLK